MKIYVKENGITVVGKAWQVKSALRHYARTFQTIEQWTKSVQAKEPTSSSDFLRSTIRKSGDTI
ncbi:MAG TPA: Z-ring formation inhibitor MciZ [Bacillales bacterium]|nr:Z-ring formation inhibitor MciZ [Bacillales bacterium]